MRSGGKITTGSGKLYGGDRGFDPATIIMQIVALQLAYYTSLSACVYLCDLCAGLRPHLAQIFSQEAFDREYKYGYPTLIAHVFNLFPWVLAEACIVEKAKKCTDFTVTVFVIHFVIMIFYNASLPSLWPISWWVIHTCLIIVATALSEVVCMKLEM